MVDREWICEFCYPDIDEIGWILPDVLYLYKDENGYFISMGQGHNGEEIITFPKAYLSGADEDDKWLEYFLSFRIQLDIQSGHTIGEAARLEGWDKNHENLTSWLADRAAKMIL